MKTYRLKAAIELIAKHGYVFTSISRDHIEENRVVTLHQDWDNKGREFADIRLALGKYRGNSLGRGYRHDPLKEFGK